MISFIIHACMSPTGNKLSWQRAVVPLFRLCVSLPGDKLSWQRAVLRSILRRQAVERELLLQVLQDPGFGDLVEAAAGSMEPEERWQRLAQLAEKHQNLDLSTPGKCFFFLQFIMCLLQF